MVLGQTAREAIFPDVFTTVSRSARCADQAPSSKTVYLLHPASLSEQMLGDIAQTRGEELLQL